MPIQAAVSGPLVTLDCVDVVTEEELDVIFGAFEQAARVGPFVALTNTSRMKTAGRPVLTAFANRLKQLPKVRDRWLGDAIVVTSPVVQFFISTLMIIAPLPTETKVFTQTIKARHWCAMLLRKNGLIVPDLLGSA